MLKRRLIPVLFLQNGVMVRSERFSIHQAIGHPIIHVQRLVQWNIDELIVLDITEGEESYDFRRDDTRLGGAKNLLEFINNVAVDCNIPLTFGGRIRSFEDIHVRIQNGADKVTLNSVVAENPKLITDAAHAFGSQAVVVSIDYRMVDGSPRVYTHHASRDVGCDAITWAERAEELGAGEIFLSAVDRDGTAQGYDMETIQKVVEAVEITVIGCGGAGHQSHFLKCLAETGASAVAAGNIFHFTENAYPRAKAYLRERRDDMR